AGALGPLVRAGRCRVTLISRQADFVFMPSLPWVACGEAEPSSIVCSLAQTRAARWSRLLVDPILDIDPIRQVIMTPSGSLSYDVLILAVGAEPDAGALPGYVDYAYSVSSLPAAWRLCERLRAGDVHRIVVYAHPSSPCAFGLYELALLLAHRGVRVQLVTSELAPGATTDPAVGRAWQRLARRFAVEVVAGRLAVEVGRRGLLLDDGRVLAADLVVAAPPPRGRAFTASLEPAVTRSGLLLTRPSLASTRWDNLLGAGAVVALSLPVNGYIAERMGMWAARTAASLLDLRPQPPEPFVAAQALLHAGPAGSGILFYRSRAHVFGPTRLRAFTAGWPLGRGKPWFRRWYMTFRV
ncbi:MAG TPA: FAD-dependent oxidoreductase, partial [Bacillota bacterium]